MLNYTIKQMIFENVMLSESDIAQSCTAFFDPTDCSLRVMPLSVALSRQEYWSGWPFPSPGDPPNLGIKPRSPELQADILPSARELPGKPK